MVSHFFVTADVTPNKTRNERLKVAFSSMFLKRKKSQCFGASSFSKSHHTRQKFPLPPLTRSSSEQKHHLAIGRNSDLLIRLNRFFHLGKNLKRSNRFFLRFFAIFCDFFLVNQIRHREKTKRTVKIYSLRWFPF